MNKLLLLNKPKGITSHDVVYKARKATGVKKVGHGGTLDPNASGLLIVGVGREATKKLGEITKNTNKSYRAEITVGEERDTDDIEGQVTRKKDIDHLSDEKITEALNSFLGKQKQKPPIYSAIKKGGRKAYELARKGKKVELGERDIEVFEAKLISYNHPLISVDFKVSSGTYIRALARDIGRALGGAAYLSNLVRTQIGEYDLKDAISLDELEKWK